MPCSHWDSHAIYEKKAYYHRKPAGKKELISTGGRERRREGGEGGKEGRREGGKEGRREGGKEGRREGGKEGRKGGREGGRKEGRRTTRRKKQRPSFKMLRAPSNLHMLFSKSCKSHAVYKFWFQNLASTVHFTDFSRNTLQTPCRVQCAYDSLNLLQIPVHLQLWASESRKIASSLQMSVSKWCKCHAVYKWQLQNTANTMRCIKFCPSMLRILCKWLFLFPKCCKHSTVWRFFLS